MIRTIYFIVLAYFLMGGIGFYFIDRKKEPEVVHKNRVKFIAYFIIINTLFLSITIYPLAFRYLSVLIIGGGFYELIKLFRKSGYAKKTFFQFSVFLFGILSLGFFFFGSLGKELVLFTFLILSIFDSFSQISGQLWGTRKILPEISPNKTLGGLIGGTTIALISALLLHELSSRPVHLTSLLSVGIVFFSFAGDVAASIYKRKFGVKNFSELIPGHGGILDRFDSLIAGGAWVALSVCVFDI